MIYTGLVSYVYRLDLTVIAVNNVIFSYGAICEFFGIELVIKVPL